MGDTPSIADVLERAAEMLSEPGVWIQGTLSRKTDDGGECFCALGALINISFVGFQAAKKFEETLPPAVPTDSLCPIAKWNDDPARTQAEVVARLREVAAAARADASHA